MHEKEIIRLRRKRIQSGESLYLDSYFKGKRRYEFLRLYLIPERTKADKLKNEQTLRLANTIKSKRLVELFNNNGPGGSATVVPVIFPLIAGAGTLTTLLSLRAEFRVENIIIAIILNMIVVYVVLSKLELIERFLGKGVIFVLRKFFGIILLAMSVKLFVTNVANLFS